MFAFLFLSSLCTKSLSNFVLLTTCLITSLVAQMVKNLPAMRETQVWSLSQENPLEKGVATHSSILAWRTLWTEEPQATVHGVTKSQTGLSTHTHTHTRWTGRGGMAGGTNIQGQFGHRHSAPGKRWLRISSVVILMDGDKACTDYSLGQRELMIL